MCCGPSTCTILSLQCNILGESSPYSNRAAHNSQLHLVGFQHLKKQPLPIPAEVASPYALRPAVAPHPTYAFHTRLTLSVCCLVVLTHEQQVHICFPHQQQGHPQMRWWSICRCQLRVYIAQNFATVAVQLFSRHAMCVCLTGLSPWICLRASTKVSGACSLVRKELCSVMSVVCQRWKLRLLLINYWLLVESAPDWYCSVVLDIC